MTPTKNETCERCGFVPIGISTVERSYLMCRDDH